MMLLTSLHEWLTWQRVSHHRPRTTSLSAKVGARTTKTCGQRMTTKPLPAAPLKMTVQTRLGPP